MRIDISNFEDSTGSIYANYVRKKPLKFKKKTKIRKKICTNGEKFRN